MIFKFALFTFVFTFLEMASHKKINPFSKLNNNTGFASNSNETGGRFINKDGSYNLIKEGMPFRKGSAYSRICSTCLYGNSFS